RNKIPQGPRLGIVTNAGGPGVMATDALIEAYGTLATLSDPTMAKLNESLPESWSHGNPVDVLGDANSKRFEKATQIVLQDTNVDAVLVILTPQAMTNPTATAKVIGDLAQSSSKPILAAFLGGAAMREGNGILAERGVPTYRTPEQAIRAFMTLVAYARNLETLYETPKDIPVHFKIDREKLRALYLTDLLSDNPILSEDVSKALLEEYGIATTRPQSAYSADEAVAVARQIGYPVVLKILSPDITHKTDVGGVALNLEDDIMVRASFERIVAGARSKRPDAKIDGVTVQPMVRAADGVELILGIKQDPVFGTVMMVGMGGISAELFRDRSLGFPPLNERLARRMLESLRIWPLLNGYRGRPPVNVDKLIESMIRLSYLAADYPEIAELDINPLLVTPTDCVALDARIILSERKPDESSERYAHLALHPYPEEYVKEIRSKEGETILFRPIKPEDEPLWIDMLSRCSKETIYSRFRYFFQWASHEVATRYCYIDYDREIAIVAEIVRDGRRLLIGVGRLIADPDHESVEYAVLITDAWQKQELGSMLTDYCMEIARHWHLKRMVAQTTTDNRPMVSVFQKREFEIKIDADSTVLVSKELA
ncbi:GNAT family N-acetyltransferase, partial [candidate division GN15 bacterium]